MNIRCFISIDLPPEIRNELELVQKEINDIPGVSITKKENLHITLKFLGELDERKIESVKKEIENLLKNEVSFESRCFDIDFFPDEQYIKIIYVGLESMKIIMDLQKKLDYGLNKLGFERNVRFAPHITIARVKFLKDREVLEKAVKKIKDYKGQKFMVKELALKRSVLTSHGPIYSDLDVFRLK